LPQVDFFNACKILEGPVPDEDNAAGLQNSRDAATQETTPAIFSKLIFVVFAWVLVGLCFIYGVRFWFNSPMHPSFIPITGAAFCAVLSFAIVLALQYTTGPIKLKFGTVDFEGASGPIVFWCVCFFVIAYGLYMMGLSDVAKATAPSDTRSILELLRTK
jgi:hypothetical protein